MPHIYRGFLSLTCCVLHRIALPVVSKWCQESVDRMTPVAGTTVVTEVV
jgi:hypothetical protein